MNKPKSKPKKLDKPANRKDDQSTPELQVPTQESPVTSPTTTTASQSLTSPTSTTTNRPSPTAWFTTEIQHMMYGFGDCRKPLLESAALIEQIVHHQMTTLLYQACDVANMRGGRFINIEDFLFLLRKDKVKLKRFIKYMTFKDMKISTVRQQSTSVEEEESQESSTEGKQPPKKRRKQCYDFLSSIDQTGELLALFEDDGLDDIKQDRLMRAEQSSRNMDPQHYLEFCEARQSSFAPRYRTQRFRDWLMTGVSVEPKPNLHAIDVLCYMAYETVAQIVDLALLVRKDMESTLEDPVSLSLPGICVNHENLQSAHAIQQHIQQQQTAVNKSPSHAGSPSATPPSTPTTPSPMTSPAGGPSLGTTPPSAATPASASKPKPTKKRKKSDSSSTTKELNCVQAIQPSDITEVLRRYGQNIGPFAPFSKTPLLPAKQRMFCL